MDYEHYSADQERIEYEIENNPELQRNELNPSGSKGYVKILQGLQDTKNCRRLPL